MKTVIKREELKRDFKDLIAMIQSKHVMGPEIENYSSTEHQ